MNSLAADVRLFQASCQLLELNLCFRLQLAKWSRQWTLRHKIAVRAPPRERFVHVPEVCPGSLKNKWNLAIQPVAPCACPLGSKDERHKESASLPCRWH